MPTVRTMNTRRYFGWICSGVAAVLTAHAQAQAVSTDAIDDRPASAPAFSIERLVPLEMPPFVSVKVGIDPETISISPNGIVRYVVVMRNASGSVSAVFEGLACANGQVTTYARAQGSGAWTAVATPVWRDMGDNLPSRHALAFARQGACDAGSTRTPADMVKALRQGRRND